MIKITNNYLKYIWNAISIIAVCSCIYFVYYSNTESSEINDKEKNAKIYQDSLSTRINTLEDSLKLVINNSTKVISDREFSANQVKFFEAETIRLNLILKKAIEANKYDFNKNPKSKKDINEYLIRRFGAPNTSY